MAFTKIVGAGIHTLSNVHTHNINSSGIITATQFVGIFTGTDGNFSGDLDVGGNVSIGGSLTVNGDFTTLNTTLREVEILNVDANSSAVAGIITQRGSGDILRLYDNASNIFSVKDGGKVLITNTLGLGGATSNPSDLLHAQSTSGEGVIKVLGATDGKVRIQALNGDSYIQFGDGSSDQAAAFQYDHGTDDLIFKHGSSTERLRIDSDGQIGIGNITPNTWSTGKGLTIGTSQATLWGVGDQINLSGNAYFNSGWKAAASKAGASQIEQALGDIDFKVSGSVTANNAITWIKAVRITKTGKVGIGTDNPDHSLHVYKEGGDSVISIESSGNGNHSALEFIRTSSGGDSKGAGSIYVTGNTSASEAIMKFAVGHNVAHEHTPSMVIMGNGEVGVGTDNPTSNLQVDGTSLQLINKVNANNTLIKVENTSTGNAGVNIKNADGEFTFLANKRLRVQDEGNGGIERVSLHQSGNVGIGTTNPSAKLEIGPKNDGTPYFRVKNHTSAGAYTNNYGSEFRHVFNSTNHAMLIHTQEASDARRTLDISDSNGIFATFANGKVGIGTLTMDSSADLSITNTGSARIYMKSGNSSDCSIIFGAFDDTATGAIRYDHSDDTLRFYGHNNTERFTIGTVGIITSYATHPQFILEDSSGRKVSLRAPSSTNYAALGTDTVHQLVFYTAGYANKRGTIHNNGQVRFGDECMSDRTSFRHQFSSSAGSPDVLSLQNPSNSDGQGINLGFWARNTNNAAIQVAQITGVADETQANSTQEGSLQFKTNGGATLSTRIDVDQTNTTLYNNVHMLKGGGSPDAMVVLQTHDTANAKASLRLLARDNSNVNETCKIQAYSDNSASVNLEFHTDTGEHLRITRNGQLWLYASGGDNQFNSKRTGATSGNGDYFYHLNAINNVDQTVGTLAFHRHSGNDDARFIIKTKKSGDDLEERMRIHADGTVQFSATGGSAQTSADNRQLFEIGSVGGIKLGNYQDGRRATPADASTITGLRAPNILDWGRDRGDPTLQAGDSISNFSAVWTSWSLNGTGTGNKWKLGQGPHGGMEWLWSGKSAYSDATSGQGGYNTSFDVDPNYSYMFITYVKRVSSNASGNFYVGTGGVADLGSGATGGKSNPYWTCGGTNALDRNIWHVCIHYVRSYHSSNTNKLPNAGTYRMSDGSRIADGAACNIGNGVKFNTTQTGHSVTYRSYLFYATQNDGTELQWAQPHAYKMDGTEPPLMELLGREIANNDDTDNWDG